MSFKPEVIADSSGKWSGNALRFATREEAEANVRDLMMRWFAVRDTRVVESDDPVNYAWIDGQLVGVMPFSPPTIVPQVHLNGTSKEELLKQLSDAHEALTNALGAMGRAAPHGRDYYVINNEAIYQAGVQHRARCSKIVEVMEELELIIQGVMAQGR